MSKNKKYPINSSFALSSNINNEQYESMYKASILHPDFFWNVQAKKLLTWSKDWKTVCNYDAKKGYTKWFEEGKLNACFNCVDRHLKHNKNKIAIIWEGDEPNQEKHITYSHLHKEICKLTNGLKKIGI